VCVCVCVCVCVFMSYREFIINVAWRDMLHAYVSAHACAAA
jgi:hypothetical protein